MAETAAAESAGRTVVEAEAEDTAAAFEIVRYEAVDARASEAWHSPEARSREDAEAETAGEAARVAEMESSGEPVHGGGNGQGGTGSTSTHGGDESDAGVDDQNAETEARENEAAAARTNVIRVGGDTDPHGSPRKGWWQRFMS